MSEILKHECGLAFIRLRKPLSYYQQRYGNTLYGVHKLFLLMEKQHNRGQDGAGVATIKLDPAPGDNFMDRQRSTDKQAIQKIFGGIQKDYQAAIDKDPTIEGDVDRLKRAVPFLGELLLDE